MKFKELNCQVSDIMLDPLNPRFGMKIQKLSQESIKINLLAPKGSKELCKSMKQNLKWISKVVVRPINSISEEILNKYYPDYQNYKYIVVEGNTRIACLKSEYMEFDESNYIPILIAEKEENESEIEYENELKITQGIANVMVVKQWGEIAKAKHLFDLFKARQEKHTSLHHHEIIKDIALELGMSTHDVRKSVLRFSFYTEINNISDTIPERHWGYLEGLEKNASIRKKLGLIDNNLTFEWSTEDYDLYPELDTKRETLSLIPEVIQAAVNSNLNTKQFRDVFVDLLSQSDDIEHIHNGLLRTLDIDNTTHSWTSKYEGYMKISKNVDEDWGKKIKDSVDVFKNLPVHQDWMIHYYNDLIDLHKNLDRTLQILSLTRNELTKDRSESDSST